MGFLDTLSAGRGYSGSASYQGVQTGPLAGAQSWNAPAGQSYFPSQTPGYLSSPKFGVRGPSFGEQLAQGLADPLRKAGYALGYRTTSGRFPTPEESGMFQEGPESKDYSQTDAAKTFLDKILGDILEGRKPGQEKKSEGGILTPTDSAAAFGPGFSPL